MSSTYITKTGLDRLEDLHTRLKKHRAYSLMVETGNNTFAPMTLRFDGQYHVDGRIDERYYGYTYNHLGFALKRLVEIGATWILEVDHTPDNEYGEWRQCGQ